MFQNTKVMDPLENKIIVFDGTCYLCRNGAMLTAKYSSISEEKLCAYNDLSDELRSKVDPSRFQNEMALVDTTGNETLYGLEGILYVISSRFKFLKWIKKGSILFNISNFFYKTLALNRYILFPIDSQIKCDCQPPLNRFYRLSFFSLCILFSLLISSLLGYSIGKHLQVFKFGVELALPATLFAVGTGWVVHILLSLLFLKGEQLYDYLGNLGTIMFVGVLLLIPGLAGAYLHAITYFPLMTLCIIVSCVIMTRMHNKRVRILGLNRAWAYSWFLLLQLSLILTLVFVLKNYEQWIS